MTLGAFALTYVTVHFRALLLFGPLAHLGQLCYGLYLTHFFVSEYVSHALPRDPFVAIATYFAVSYALALISLYAIEGPALRLRPLLERSPRAQAALAVVVLATVLTALVVVIGRQA